MLARQTGDLLWTQLIVEKTEVETDVFGIGSFPTQIVVYQIEVGHAGPRITTLYVACLLYTSRCV